MKNVDIVFVVLTYRNANDAENFILSVNSVMRNKSYEIVIVNSFYDEDSKNEIEKVALKYNQIFLNVKNKGYSYGNNRGIEYVSKNYTYKWLVVCNPDIIIQKFDLSYYSPDCPYILGPEIINTKGKRQNPHWTCERHYSERLMFHAFRDNKRGKLYLHLILEKLPKYLMNVSMKLFSGRKKVFAVHGSFLIFSSSAISRLGCPFDEDMFLFAEENHLAHLAKKMMVSMWIIPEVRVRHMEDGSIKLTDMNLNAVTRESVLTYYGKWFPDEVLHMKTCFFGKYRRK